jgi:hypothetical protein
VRIAFLIVLIAILMVDSPSARTAEAVNPAHGTSLDSNQPANSSPPSGVPAADTKPLPATTEQSEASVSKSAADAIQGLLAPTSTQLEQLEKEAFSHSYTSDTNEQRICRLENFVFGKQLAGDTSTRLKKLRNALSPKSLPKADTTSAGSGFQSQSSPGPNPGSGFQSQSSPGPNPGSGSQSESASSTITSAAPAAPTKTHASVIDVMNRGIDNYNRHRYQNAEDDFEECCAMAPGMSRCYSYLAITKMQLNLRQAAIDSFRMSNMLDPFGTYGRYARECLIVLAGDEAMRNRPPVDSRKVLDIAMSQIDRQSSEHISQQRQQANELANTRLTYRPDMSVIESRINSNKAQIDGALRAAETAESANNLKHMLAVKKRPGNANLRAWGTTLTTRYYGNETYLNAPYYIPRERPMELKAIVQSLQSAQHPRSARSTSTAHHARAAQKSGKSSSIHSHSAPHRKRG